MFECLDIKEVYFEFFDASGWSILDEMFNEGQYLLKGGEIDISD